MISIKKDKREDFVVVVVYFEAYLDFEFVENVFNISARLGIFKWLLLYKVDFVV